MRLTKVTHLMVRIDTIDDGALFTHDMISTNSLGGGKKLRKKNVKNKIHDVEHRECERKM